MSSHKINSFAAFQEFEQQITDALRRPSYMAASRLWELLGGVPNEDNYWGWREALRAYKNPALASIFKPYEPTVFQDELWINMLHFVHVSADDTTMVAYTPNAEKGRVDIQIKMNVGKYLTKFYGTGTPTNLSNEVIKDWAQKHRDKCEEGEIHYAVTADEIEDVYRNGPQSCMDGRQSCMDAYMPNTGGVHPAQVYGGPDTVVAYTKRDGRINARVMCNISVNPPIYGRIYGDTLIGPRLEAQGFVQNNKVMLGTRLRKMSVLENSAVFAPDVYVMAYLDGPSDSTRCQIQGQYIIVTSNNQHPSGQNQYGHITLEDTSTHVHCQECGTLVNPAKLTSTHNGKSVCPACLTSKYVFAIVASQTSAYVPFAEAERISSQYYWINGDLAAVGIVRLTNSNYEKAEQAVTSIEGDIISVHDVDYVKLACGGYARVSSITVDWAVVGPAYKKRLGITSGPGTMSLGAFLREISNYKFNANDLNLAYYVLGINTANAWDKVSDLALLGDHILIETAEV
jgi:hypothetical protein